MKEVLCVTINEYIKVFDNVCSELLLNLAFEAVVDTCCITGDNKFMLVCLRTGVIKLIYATSESLFNM